MANLSGDVGKVGRRTAETTREEDKGWGAGETIAIGGAGASSTGWVARLAGLSDYVLRD